MWWLYAVLAVVYLLCVFAFFLRYEEGEMKATPQCDMCGSTDTVSHLCADCLELANGVQADDREKRRDELEKAHATIRVAAGLIDDLLAEPDSKWQRVRARKWVGAAREYYAEELPVEREPDA